MASPYEMKEDWTIVATKFENTIYLFRVDKENAMMNNRNPLSGEMAMWGFKFEQYLCSGKFFIVFISNTEMLNTYFYIHFLNADSPDSSPDPEKLLNTNAEFCCIIKTKLAGQSLLYGAEVDAIRKDYQPPWLMPEDGKIPTLEGFVELKTNRLIENQRQRKSFYQYFLHPLSY